MSLSRRAALALLFVSAFVTQARAQYYLDETAPPPPKPLESLLQRWGLGQEKTGINVYGFVEGSYTYGLSSPTNDVLSGRVFDIDNQEVILNQIDLTFEKTVDAAAAAKDNKWSLGGKVEVIYGNDARFTHANGLNFYGAASPQLSPENQFDLVQAYVDLALPVGSGLTLRAGKFVTLLGYETINPTSNPLYSHSFEFGYGIPFTHTGVLAMYSLTDKLSVTGGITRGWEQATRDNNDALDVLGQVKYVFNDKLTGYFNFVTGPEETDDNSLWRTVFDAVLSCTATSELTVGANPSFGFEPGASPSGGAAQWYGVALYTGYKCSDYCTINLRGEWFADPQGARGLGGNWYEVTAGLGVHPFPHSDLGQNLLIRPELRWDYSADGNIDAGTDHQQWTAAIDAIFQF
jgi:hypothetical protein